MVLEAVSRSSVTKDTELLRDAYAAVGVLEYWLVDCRTAPLRFDILRLVRGRYVMARPREGWTRSAVFGRSFRLVRAEDEDGYPSFVRETRE
ncbi:MAG: Uma2 family endonuclease [Gemmataceae bacterium]|nr:Uma2 family endonuclease [Gemmataceae bacterium]